MADAGGEKRKGGGHGGGGKGKKAKYTPAAQAASGAAIPHNSQGVLITCDTLKDRNTARDILTLLNEVWDEHEGKAAAAAAGGASGGGDGASLDKLLASEVADLKDPKQQRFEIINLNQKSLTYLQKKTPADGPVINDLVAGVLRKAEKTQESRAKYCHRILPIETVCYASQEEIVKNATALIQKHFPSGPDAKPVTFAVMYAARCCDGLQLERMQVIDAIAKAVPQPHKVCLDNPDLAILVEVVKSACCLSVLRDYYALCKYNIRVIAMPPDQRPEAPGGKKGKDKSADGAAKKEGAAAAAAGGEAAAAAAAPAAGEAAKAEGEAKA